MAAATKLRFPLRSVAGATTALVLLTALNLVNYIDRYILPGVQELVKKEFGVSDSRIGSITFWFFLTYMLSAPFTGWLGDHLPRKPLLIDGLRVPLHLGQRSVPGDCCDLVRRASGLSQPARCSFAQPVRR